MKFHSTILFIILIFSTTINLAQEMPLETTIIPEEKIYKTSELTKETTFPGGMQKFYIFISKLYKVPETPPNIKLKGSIYITFIVEKDGSISNERIIRDIGYGTGEESLRVLRLCPKWIPGKINEKNVRVQYTLPIAIQEPDRREKENLQNLKQQELTTLDSIKPSFPGGIKDFYQFIHDNFKITKEAFDNKIKGKVHAAFVVEKDGSLSDFKILNDLGYGTGEEIIRVLKLSPKWSPGIINGKTVRCQYSVPITIQTE
ncbi:energy transducer TonB [Flavobacterium ovatum]|uniref:energy transducer TonB n=1 Tax=Flavobacterium ovatum TaxID=1928857 RepID=UPI00344BCAD2